MYINNSPGITSVQRASVESDRIRYLVPKISIADNTNQYAGLVPRGDGTWGNVPNADYAVTADFAYSADSASYANSCDTANYAYSADSAYSASSVTSSFGGDIYANGYSLYDLTNLNCYKITATVTDPEMVLYDETTRESVKALTLRAIPVEKQTGAAMFFNKITKRIEIYVASEDKYYDILGNEIINGGNNGTN
jgi:hypothetical protein